MKTHKRKIIIIILILLIVVAIAGILSIYIGANKFSARLGFEPNKDYTLFENSLGIKNGNVALKYDLDDSDLDSYIATLKDKGYTPDEDTYINVNQNTKSNVEKWDLENSDISSVYYTNSSRNVIFASYYADIYVYIGRSDNGQTAVYVYYSERPSDAK